MNTKSNLHTHCTYCDGKSSMDSMALSAIEKGLCSLGFSSHCPTGFNFDESQISIEKLDSYFNDLENLKEKYDGRLEIFKGLELEHYILGNVRPTIDKRCDYTIGSLHFIKCNDKYFSIDYKTEVLKEALESFNGAKNLIHSYYEQYLSFAKQVPFDIIGHIDIYCKLNDRMQFFDPNEAWYKGLVIPYIDELIKTDKIFEVNTGAIARGYKKEPYPTNFILKRLLEKKAQITISSDSHDKNTITYFFDETELMLKELGFKEQVMLTKNGFVSVAL